MHKPLIAVLALLTFGAAAPVPTNTAKLEYSWTKSGFVELRRFVTVTKAGEYESGYNGTRACHATGSLPKAENASLWNDAQALFNGSTQTRRAPSPSPTPKPPHSFGGRTAMDDGPPGETLSLETGGRSWTMLDIRAPDAQHLMNRLRQLLPPCAL